MLLLDLDATIKPSETSANLAARGGLKYVEG